MMTSSFLEVLIKRTLKRKCFTVHKSEKKLDNISIKYQLGLNPIKVFTTPPPPSRFSANNFGSNTGTQLKLTDFS